MTAASPTLFHWVVGTTNIPTSTSLSRRRHGIPDLLTRPQWRLLNAGPPLSCCRPPACPSRGCAESRLRALRPQPEDQGCACAREVRHRELASVGTFAYPEIMYATAVVEGKVVRFKLSPALARAHLETRDTSMTDRDAVGFVEAKRRARALRRARPYLDDRGSDQRHGTRSRRPPAPAFQRAEEYC